MSCNIKLAVSESSQLSVSSVVLACRAAHLCLLDKTCCTLSRENTVSLPFLFSLSPWHAFSFTLFLSISIIPFVCLSRAYPAQYPFLFRLPLLFFKSTAAFPRRSSPLSPAQFIFSGLSSLLLFSRHPLVSLLPLLPLSVFYFVLFWDLFVSPEV